MTDAALFDAVTGTAMTDGDYTYLVSRRWSPGDTPAMFVMLHPTLANAETDDATVRKCMAIARHQGCTSAILLNLYALRAPNRDTLFGAGVPATPIGAENDAWLARQFYVAAQIGAPLIAAWGPHPPAGLVAVVRHVTGADRFTCLGTNADGSPVHPSHAVPTAPLRPWAPR